MNAAAFRGALALGLVSLALGAQAIVIRSDRTDQQYRDFAQNFPSVGFVQNSVGRGSGVLIAPNWVLTAAHVIPNGSTNVRFTVGGTQYNAAEFFVNPGYVGGSAGLSGGFDLTLIRLSQTVTNVTPSRLYFGSDEVGQEGALVGFGNTGTGLTGQSTSSQVKRAGTNVVDSVGEEFSNITNVLMMDFDPANPNNRLVAPFGPFVQNTPTNLEAGAGQGDSGGGFFLNVNGEWRVAGIASFVTNHPGIPLGAYGSATGYTRVSSNIEWIGSIAPEAIPEPTTMTALALGAGLMALRRRRKNKA